MRLKILNEDVTDESRALRDYVYEEAQSAGSNSVNEYSEPLTKEDRAEAYSRYIGSDSFMTWWNDVVRKRAMELASFGVDAEDLFSSGEFDLNEATKTGFYSGFGD